MSDASPPSLVGLRELREAAAALRGVAIRTPLLPSPGLGGGVYLKPEMLQRGGAFKLRGAYTFISRLHEAQRARGVIAPSSGNHAQAVALAACMLGTRATVVMPTTVTPAKRAGAERLGARIELAGTTTNDRMERALAIAAAEGQTLVPPYDDPTIIAGQGTVGLEIAEDLPDVAAVVVPVGGGGLSAGVAAAIKLTCPGAQVIAVEPEGAPKLTRALAAGTPVDLGATSGLADGLLAVRIGTLPFAHHRAYVDRVVTIADNALAAAMRYLLDRHKLVAEPSGAIAVAAVLTGAVAVTPPAALVLSGGNVEWPDLLRLLA